MLGADRYGVLSLCLVVIGYFGILDFGLGGAAVKYLAEELGARRESGIAEIFWTNLLWQCCGGAAGALVLAAATPLLVGSWLNIPPAMVGEVTRTLHWLCFAVPLMLITPCLAGTLEAAQRFDLVNAVAVPEAAILPLALYAGAVLRCELPSIMAMIVALRVAVFVVYFGLCLRTFPALSTIRLSWAWVKKLLSFGGWSVASGIIAPFLMYTDRFMLGRYTSLSSVAYYTVPYGLMLRLWFLPSSLVRTLFPALSALGAEDPAQREDLFLRSIKYMAMASGPLILGLATFSSDIFRIWLGPEYELHCAPVLRILLYGAIFSMLAPLCGSLLQGMGRPDVTTKWYAACLPFNTLGVWLLVRWAGVRGAAATYSLRAAAETVVFAVVGVRLAEISYEALRRHRLWGTAATLCFLAALMAGTPLIGGLPPRLAAYAAGAAMYLGLAWIVMLDDEDRGFVKDQLRVRLRAQRLEA
jgi:O-antigen/teichoic acid export membrane protein